ncbi:M48 family metallopeptidase [Halobacteriovorax sp. HLS]|uniref:M48 family metallopeptidase n=1 Tax=Halobacteriovorax sp. HLS TaxID=2234000 RepID=UPI0013E31B70|nr:SprT family zinc-dependent metalloprotease [Halobacteriovorax sp. HLS]
MIEGIETKIERTKRRKTIGFEIQPGNIVRILVPVSIDDSYVEKILEKKAVWIQQKVDEANKILITQRKREFVAGESFPLLGKEYRLKVSKGINAPAIIQGNSLIVSIPKRIETEDIEVVIKSQLKAFYKAQALIKFEEMINRFSMNLGVRPAAFDIRDYKNSWGVCTSKGEVFINWCLVMAPISVINYVIVHELCHLVYPNHSKSFWNLVASQINDIEESKRWLKYNQLSLGF